MAPRISEYERKRLENIKKNEEMMAKLMLQSKALQFSSATKHQRNETKINKTTRTKKLKSEFPIILRRSPRTHGVVVEAEPEPEPSSQEVTEDESIESETSPRKLGPLTMEEAYNGDSSDRPLINTIMSMSNAASSSCSEKRELVGNVESFDPQSMVLKPENIARVMPDKILNLKFFPCNDRTIVASGNSAGEIAFWDVDCEDEDCDGIYLYRPHESSISGISIQPFSLSKVFSSCYGGLIRVMDVGRESFDLVYSTDISIFCLSQQPNDSNTLYFGQGSGLLSVFDVRVGKPSDSRRLHELRINTLDFNPENINLVATSSTDGTACIWDVRYINAQKPKYLKMAEYTKSVHSAYFSPSGKFLATTCVDDKIGILGGVDFMDTSTIDHLHRNAAGVSYFRAIWGWDDSYLFIGHLNGGVDVISTVDQSMGTLESSHITACPLRFAAHPYKVGTLAGGTSCRKIYVWTTVESKKQALFELSPGEIEPTLHMIKKVSSKSKNKIRHLDGYIEEVWDDTFGLTYACSDCGRFFCKFEKAQGHLRKDHPEFLKLSRVEACV